MYFSKDSVDILISKVKNFLTDRCRVTGDKPSFSSRGTTANWYRGEKRTEFNVYACEFYIDNPTQSGSPDGILKIVPYVIDDNGTDKCTSVILQYSSSNNIFRTIAYISSTVQFSGPYMTYATPDMVALTESTEGIRCIERLIDIIGKYRFERIICAFTETIPVGIKYSTYFEPELQDFIECQRRFAHALRVWANCHNECLMPIFTPFEQLLSRDERVWYVHYPSTTKFVLKHSNDHEILDVYKLDSKGYVQRKLTDDEVRRAFGHPFHDEIVAMFTDIEKRKKESVDKPFIGQKITFGDKAHKKWADLYTLLYDHFAGWCRCADATLQQKTFSYSCKMLCPTGIDFYIMKRSSRRDSKDKFKFAVLYDELTEKVTLRFFAENVDIVVDGHQIHESGYCEPIISAFLFDKPKEGVKMFDITNGDNDNKMENDWRPLDVLKVYFGDKFWNNIIDIFGKFIPKQTEIFYENMLKRWSSDPEYQFFDYIRYQFSKFAREWFLNGSVKQIIKSINSVDWEVTVMDSDLLAETNSFRRYRIELRHRICVKDSNGISDDNLAFYKIDPVYGPRRIIPYGLDHEFGNGFSSHVESIYYSVRMKIKEFVKEEKKMNDDKKKEFDAIREAMARLTGTLTEVEPMIWTREEFEKITEDLKKLAESATKEEKKMTDKKKEFFEVVREAIMAGSAETSTLETGKSKTDDPKFPHFSTDKNGQKLVTIPWDVYRTMANTQYGMAVTLVKDRRAEIKDAYWNPKTGVATILWADGSKTMSKPMEGTAADPEIGFAICIAKKFMGGTQNKWRKWLKATIDASAASAKKKGDKNLVKLEKQARARWFAQQILDPTPDQIETMIGIIKKENAEASKKAEDTANTETPKKQRRPRQKKSTGTK